MYFFSLTYLILEKLAQHCIKNEKKKLKLADEKIASEHRVANNIPVKKLVI